NGSRPESINSRFNKCKEFFACSLNKSKFSQVTLQIVHSIHPSVLGCIIVLLSLLDSTLLSLCFFCSSTTFKDLSPTITFVNLNSSNCFLYKLFIDSIFKNRNEYFEN